MRFKFFSHLIVMVLLNLLIKPIAIFGIDAAVQNRVGAVEYGVYFSLLNFTYLFNILMDFGITNYNTKHIAQYPHLAKQYIGKMIPLRLVLFLIYTAITLVLAFGLHYNSQQFKLIYLLIINQFLVSLILYFRSYFAGLLQFKTEIILSVMDKLLLISIAGSILYLYKDSQMNIELFVQIQLITYVLTLLIAVVLLLKKLGLPKLKWNFSFNRVIILKSFPYALLIVLMMLYNRMDSVMLERMLPGSKETGIYAQAYRILDACFMFAGLFSGLLFPLFSNMIKQKIPFLSLLDSSSRVLISGALMLAFLCFFNGEFLLNLVYSNDVHQSSAILGLLMFGFVPVCITLIFGTLLTANGNLKFLNLISFGGILLNFGMNVVLIPRYGAFGACISCISTQSVIALCQFIYVFKTFRLRFQLKAFLRYAGLVVLLAGSGMLLQQFSNQILNILTLLGLAGIYCLVSQLFQWNMLLDLLKKR